MNLTVLNNASLTFLNGTLTVDANGNVTYSPTDPTVTGTTSQRGNSTHNSPVWFYTLSGTPVRQYTFRGTEQSGGNYTGTVVGPPRVTGAETGTWEASATIPAKVVKKPKQAKKKTNKATAS